MLSAEKNKTLTQVGPGTPMGDYLRRYWMPIGGASELAVNPIKPIRLLGENLVLYKDLGADGLRDRALVVGVRALLGDGAQRPREVALDQLLRR